MVNVITFTRAFLWFVVFSFFLFVSLYSCGGATEVSERPKSQNDLSQESNLVQQEEAKVEIPHTYPLKDEKVDLVDIKEDLGNQGSEVLQPKLATTDSSSEVDSMEECRDYDLYYEIYVERVLSDHVVTGFCGIIPITIQYAGVKSLENRDVIFEKAIALNTFLVSGKKVILRAYEKRFDQGVIHVLGEIFVDGESVTIRLISTGLVTVSPSDVISDRIGLFLESSEKSKEYHGRDSKNNTNQTGMKDSVPPIGCGTLPCQP